jgi:hypothetical protein
MHMLHDVRVHCALGDQTNQDALSQKFFASGDNVTWLVLALNSAVFRIALHRGPNFSLVLIRPYFLLRTILFGAIYLLCYLRMYFHSLTTMLPALAIQWVVIMSV